MSHTDGNPSEPAFQASAQALESLTTAAQQHAESPLSHIHAPTAQESTNSWIKKLFPPQVVSSYEAKYHMGNYVIDRQTGQKFFESMSIYVRVGMHLLYYGTEQEKALHWKRTLELLKKQSEQMGKDYDSPASKAHIIPFIQSFDLADSMAEMVKPNP